MFSGISLFPRCRHCPMHNPHYRPPSMDHRPRPVRAGVAYFAIVFAAGFALGTMRVLFVAPHLGELPATLLELPIMLGISWLVCGSLLSRFEVPPRTRPRLTMGALAFGLLMLAELVLSLTLSGRSIDDYAEALTTPQGALGLAGQILFGLMPLIRNTRTT